jgi:hypothetical protein
MSVGEKVITISLKPNQDALTHRRINIGVQLDAGLTCPTVTSI